MEIGMNVLQGNYKICNFTVTVSLHYLGKLQRHKTAHFEANCRSILMHNSKNESKWAVVRVCVQYVRHLLSHKLPDDVSTH